MQKTIRVTPFLLFLLFLQIHFQILPARCETVVRLIKLHMQSPSSIAAVLQQTFGRRLRVAEAPMVNGVVVSSDNPSVLTEAEELVKKIDRVPATLRYQIKSIGEDEVNQLTAGMNTQVDQSVIVFEPNFENRKISSRGSQTRMITGMEGYPVGLTDQMTQVETLGTPWGPQDHIRTENRGLQISGRLAGDAGFAIVEVGYAEGGFNQSRNLQTVVKVPLGQWFLIGTLLGDGADQTGQTTIISKSGRIDRTKFRSAQSKRFLIRIDALPSNGNEKE